jgi:hypothetical protein
MKLRLTIRTLMIGIMAIDDVVTLEPGTILKIRTFKGATPLFDYEITRDKCS